MLIDIIEIDGSLIDSFQVCRGKVGLSLDDARRKQRRLTYHQQAHIQRALQGTVITRKIKEQRIDLDNPFDAFVTVDVDQEGRPPVTLCGRFGISDTVSILKSIEHNTCSVGQVRRCGSVWACPVCGSKILRGRADEIRAAVDRFEDSNKYMVTLTASHSIKTNLKDFVTAFRSARRKLARTKAYSRFRKQCAGYITAAEITWSPRNGWHWHVHELWLDTPYEPDFGLDWQKALASEGLVCNQANGYNVKKSWNAADYLAKTGIQPDERRWDTGKELTSSQKGRGIWDIAPEQYKLVVEHYKATRGMRRISWSRYLKKMCGVEETTDPELNSLGLEGGNLMKTPKYETETEEVIRIPQYIWSQVHKHGLVPDVLECAEAGGANLILETICNWVALKWSEASIRESRKLRTSCGVLEG